MGRLVDEYEHETQKQVGDLFISPAVASGVIPKYSIISL